MNLEQKILSLIDDANYVEAANIYQQQKGAQLSPSVSLQLARAYHCLGNYEAALGVLEKVKPDSYPNIAQKYEAIILQLKERYLLERDMDVSLRSVEALLLSTQLGQHHRDALNEMKEIVSCNVADKPISQLHKEAREYSTLSEKQTGVPDINVLNWQGFPGFLIPKSWFEQWKNYARINLRAINLSNPGVISQFEILDHRFHHLTDPSPQKAYTNQLLFDTEEIMVIPSKCWKFLSGKYGGVSIQRYSKLSSSNIVETEVELQRINIRIKGESGPKHFVQISLTSFWRDLQEKLVRILGKGRIWKYIGGKMFPIEPMKLLQSEDLSNMEIVFERNTSFKVEPNEMNRCGNCGKTQKLKLCKDCKSIRYCNMDCMKNHRKKHEKTCRMLAKQFIELDNLSIKYNLTVQEQIKGKKGIVGLRNLGNTCYINSSLQCLSNTRELTSFFMSAQFVKRLNLTNVLGSGGEVACYYAKLVRQLWTSNENAISSWQLKREISKKFAQFAGYSQHDSLEFLGALLDVLHEDTNLIKMKPITSQNQSQKSDQEASEEAYANYQKRNKSFISDCLTSQYKTTVVCPKCHKKLTSFEHFTILPLPIPQSFQIEFNFIRAKHQNQKLDLLLYPQDKVRDIAEALSNRYNINCQDMRFFRLGSDYSVKEQYCFENSIERLVSADRGELHTCYQIPLSNPKTTTVYQLQFFQQSGSDKISYPRFITLPSNADEDYIRQAIKQSLRIYTQNEIKDSLFQFRIRDKAIGVYLSKNIFSRQSYYGSMQQIEVHRGVQSYSLRNCFDLFSKEQVLDEQNTWYCKQCKQHVRAFRRIQLYRTNKLLIIALKRYSRGRKIKTMIEYPVESLDIKEMGAHPTGVYDLYGVINHYGSLINGHYTAYCKNFVENRWYEFNDSKVTSIKGEMVINGNAYILFYRKRD